MATFTKEEFAAQVQKEMKDIGFDFGLRLITKFLFFSFVTTILDLEYFELIISFLVYNNEY